MCGIVAILNVKEQTHELRDKALKMSQKIRLSGIGIFKVGFSSIGVSRVEDCTASTITSRRVLFQPETERIVTGSADTRTVVQKASSKRPPSTTAAPMNSNFKPGNCCQANFFPF